MNADDLRRMALALPEAVESSHFGNADFRVRGKIFAALPEEARAVIKLMPDQQMMMFEAEPALFLPVKGGWGRKGWTNVDLAAVDPPTLGGALRLAWRNVAPVTLARKHFPGGLGIAATPLSGGMAGV